MPKNCFLQLFIYLKITKGFFDKENKSKVIGKLKRSNKTFYQDKIQNNQTRK